MTREKAKKIYDEDPQEDCMGLIDAIYNEFKNEIDDLLNDIKYTKDKDLIVSKIKKLKDKCFL